MQSLHLPTPVPPGNTLNGVPARCIGRWRACVRACVRACARVISDGQYTAARFAAAVFRIEMHSGPVPLVASGNFRLSPLRSRFSSRAARACVRVRVRVRVLCIAQRCCPSPRVCPVRVPIPVPPLHRVPCIVAALHCDHMYRPVSIRDTVSLYTCRAPCSRRVCICYRMRACACACACVQYLPTPAPARVWAATALTFCYLTCHPLWSSPQWEYDSRQLPSPRPPSLVCFLTPRPALRPRAEHAPVSPLYRQAAHAPPPPPPTACPSPHATPTGL